MNKLDKAHDYAVKLLEHGDMTPEEIVETSWFIVDLMQKEYDKREQEATDGKILKQDDWQQSLRERPKTVDELKKKVEKRSSGFVQQIPRPFFVNGDEIGNLDKLKEIVGKSLPNVESKKYSCNCAHWKNSSFFMGDTFKCNDCGGMVTI